MKTKYSNTCRFVIFFSPCIYSQKPKIRCLEQLNQEIFIHLRISSKTFSINQFYLSNFLSLFRYLYSVLQRNPIVFDVNRDLLIETLRSISEILIWGDQHDSSVFEYVFILK